MVTQYDVANRLKQKTLGGGGVLSYTYDPVGNLVTAVDATGTQRAAYTYDPYGGHATAERASDGATAR